MNFLAAQTHYENPKSLGARFRAARAKILKRSIDQVYEAKGRCRIIDLGGHALFWRGVGNDYLNERQCHITLLNVASDELDRNASAMAGANYLTAAVGDACATDFPDGAFDLVHSNSTVEHVGDWPRMVAFAGEVRRLAPAYFVQTPNFWFPIEPHFVAPIWHWLPEQVRVSLLMRRGFGHFPRASSVEEAVSAIQSIRLLDSRYLAALFPDARIVGEKFLGMTKSLLAIRGA